MTIGPEGYDTQWDDVSGLYYDRKGEAISLRRFCELMEDHSYRQVCRDDLPAWGGVVVSTLWLGLDFGLTFLSARAPVIFETMVFCNNIESGLNRLQQRYATEQQARKGHADIVAEIVNDWVAREDEAATKRGRHE